jgi:hypothetical protein
LIIVVTLGPSSLKKIFDVFSRGRWAWTCTVVVPPELLFVLECLRED